MKTPFAEAAITFTLFIPTRALSAVQQDIQNTQTGWFLSPSYKNVYRASFWIHYTCSEHFEEKKTRKIEEEGKNQR